MGSNEQHAQKSLSDKQRDATIVWFTDRSNFHTWFTTLIVGSFISGLTIGFIGNLPV